MTKPTPTCPVCGSQRILHNRIPVTTATWTRPEPEFWIEGTLECLDCNITPPEDASEVQRYDGDPRG